MNETRRVSTPSRAQVSGAVAELMPYIMRGMQLDFFIKRGVTQTQFLLLASIRAYAQCTMGTLARNLHVSMPTATGIVNRLVQAGYVQRAPQPEDRRQVIVRLTQKGQRFFRDFQDIIRHRWEEALISLEPRELRAFHDVLTKLRDRLRPATD